MAQTFLEVNQFHSGLALGDAVTADMLEIQRVLKGAGYNSRIFGEHIGTGLEGRVEAVANYGGDAASCSSCTTPWASIAWSALSACRIARF